MDDYVDVSSFTHHPFYSRFIIEVPDNWMWAEVYNVPLEEMMQIVDNALENGYTVAWGTDVSEKGFSRTKGIGVIPEADLEGMSGTEAERWASSPNRRRRLPSTSSTNRARSARSRRRCARLRSTTGRRPTTTAC